MATELLRLLGRGESTDKNQQVLEREFFLYDPAKAISPELTTDLVRQNQATYVELEEIGALDFCLIKQLQQIKEQTNRPLVVNFHNSTNNQLLPPHEIAFFLSALQIVDYVVIEPNPNTFSLRDGELSLRSNAHFLTPDVAHEAKSRMRRGPSTLKEPWEKAKLQGEKIIKPEDLVERVATLQAEGKRVGIMTGTFDALHPGHIRALEKASQAVDTLIVMTNSDSSISQQPKNVAGDRPIHPLAERVNVLEELTFVDHIVPFNEPNVVETFQQLHNITYIKTAKDGMGTGVQQEMEIISANGGETIILPVTFDGSNKEELSSSRVIDQTRNADEERTRVLEFSEFIHPVNEILKGLVATINKYDSSLGMISKWRKALARKYTGSLDFCAKTEEQVSAQIVQFTRQFLADMPMHARRNYLSYVLPLVLGKMTGVEIGTLPIRLQNESTTRIINYIKLSNGKVVFLDGKYDAVFSQIKFEDNFWKAMPHQFNYHPKTRDNIFQLVYNFPSDVQTQATGSLIALEEYKIAKIQGFDTRAFAQSLKASTVKIWEFYEQEPFNPSPRLPKHKTKHPYRLPRIVAHGGIQTALFSTGVSENSRESFETALSQGVDIVELDIVPAKDGWIVSHDQYLNFTTNRKGNTHDFNVNQLTSVPLRSADGSDSHSYLMSLEQVLDLIKQYRGGDSSREIYVKIDIKVASEKLEPELIDTIRRSGLPMEKVLITAGLAPINRRIHALSPELPFEFNTIEPTLLLYAYNLMDEELMPDNYLDYIRHYAPRLNAKTVSLPVFALSTWGGKATTKIVREIHRMGLETQVWVTNNPRDIEYYASIGVTHILIDKPEGLEYGLNLQRRFGWVADFLNKNVAQVMKSTRLAGRSKDQNNFLLRKKVLMQMPADLLKWYSPEELEKYIYWIINTELNK